MPGNQGQGFKIAAWYGTQASRGYPKMRPLTVITGILLGSSLSITVGLAAVLLIFLVLGDDYPRLRYEFRPLTASLAIFSVMTVICAASFYSLLIDHPARWAAQGLLWLGVLGVGYYYWP